MKTVFRASIAAALGLLATAGHAAQTTQQTTCLTSEEANALFMSVSPSILKSLSDKCAQTLPANAYLRASGPGLVARYAAPAAKAKPAAISAFVKLSGQTAINDQMFDLITGSMIGEMVVGKIKPTDCTEISRVAELLDPLPPENFTGLIVVIMELMGKGEKTKKPPFTICGA